MDRFNKAPWSRRPTPAPRCAAQAHAFADDFVQALGRKAIGQTKIAFVVEAGYGKSEVYVSDFDGNSPQPVTRDNTLAVGALLDPGPVRPLLQCPTSSETRPSSRTTFRTARAKRWRGTADRASARPVVARRPSGRDDLSKDGWTDLYHRRRRRRQLEAADKIAARTSPRRAGRRTANGFVLRRRSRSGDRSAASRLRRRNAQRIPTAGVSEPDRTGLVPDGRWIAFTSQMGGFAICVVPAEGGAVTAVGGRRRSVVGAEFPDAGIFAAQRRRRRACLCLTFPRNK